MSRPAQSAPQFVTEFGVDVPALTTEQMRELDRIAMEETGPNLFQMMENAGRNLAQVAIDMLGRTWEAARITVLAGPGGVNDLQLFSQLKALSEIKVALSASSDPRAKELIGRVDQLLEAAFRSGRLTQV